VELDIDTQGRTARVTRNAPRIGRRPGTLVTIGSGIKAISQFTFEAEAYLDWADVVFYCVADPATDQWIRNKRKDATDLYTLYDNGKNRHLTYIQMAERMLEPLREGFNVVGIFYGHPGIFVSPTHRAITIARQEGHDAFMLPAVSSIDCLSADLGVDPSKGGCQIVEATDLLLRRRPLLVDGNVIILQAGSVGDPGFCFSGFPNEHFPILLRYLQDAYSEHYEIIHYVASQFVFCEPVIERYSLSQLYDPALAKRISGISTLYIPPKSGLTLETIDLDMAAKLGLKIKIESHDTISNPTAVELGHPVAPSVGAYTKTALQAIAQLRNHETPQDYKPSRPSPAFYELVKDLSLKPALLEEFLQNPHSVLRRHPDLTPSERAALVGNRFGGVRLVMQRSTKEVAEEFVRKVLRDISLSRRYDMALRRRPSSATGPEAIRAALIELGYDTTAADVSEAFSNVLNEELATWEGDYQLIVDGNERHTLSVKKTEVLLDSNPIHDYEFSAATLTWNEGNTSSADLRFFVFTAMDGEPLADGAYVGPQCRGVLWTRGAERPSKENTVGKVGVFGVDNLVDPTAADPLSLWSGAYETHLLSTRGTWAAGPTVALDGSNGKRRLLVDGQPVAQWSYSNGILGWLQPGSSYCGSVTFFQERVGSDVEGAFVGRLWRGSERTPPVVNAVAREIKTANG
jgi:hypothetical protein